MRNDQVLQFFRVAAKPTPALQRHNEESIRIHGTVLAALMGLWKGMEWGQKLLNLRLIK